MNVSPTAAAAGKVVLGRRGGEGDPCPSPQVGPRRTAGTWGAVEAPRLAAAVAGSRNRSGEEEGGEGVGPWG